MPIYDYKCTKCDKILEVEQKPSDLPLNFCPSCGGELRRIFHPVGVVFKGSGFHVTDYKKEKGKKEHKEKPKNK